jgi:7-carboxy-7-deazaguanine synthase
MRPAQAGVRMRDELRIAEVFYSLQGEARSTGKPTVFIRLTGCPLRCQYCDTSHAFSGGVTRSIDSLVEEVAKWNTQLVCVTGGEPLAQPTVRQLLKRLCNDGYEVSLETSGAMSLEDVDQRVSRVMDLKTPSSGESQKNLYDNISLLTQNDQVKFVIGDRGDYLWARSKVQIHDLTERVSDVLFSPVAEVMDAKSLAEWIVADQLKVRMQIQLHKMFWGNAQGR